MKEKIARRDRLSCICGIVQSYFYTLNSVTCVFGDILSSSCFESIRAKLKFSFFKKLTDHERENLTFERNYGPKDSW